MSDQTIDSRASTPPTLGLLDSHDPLLPPPSRLCFNSVMNEINTGQLTCIQSPNPLEVTKLCSNSLRFSSMNDAGRARWVLSRLGCGGPPPPAPATEPAKAPAATPPTDEIFYISGFGLSQLARSAATYLRPFVTWRGSAILAGGSAFAAVLLMFQPSAIASESEYLKNRGQTPR